MDRREQLSTEHFAFTIPYNIGLPYRAKKELMEKIRYVFSHATLPKDHVRLFLDVSGKGSKGLLKDMAVRGIAMTRYYLEQPQQFGHSMENVELQILVRMWKQVFWHLRMQCGEVDKYYAVKLRTLAIDNGLFDELIRVVKAHDYWEKDTDMLPKRVRKAKRFSHTDYLCGLE